MEPNKKVFISGIGIISAIGNSKDECLDSLRNSKTGIGAIRYLETEHKDEFMLGEVKMSNHELFQHLEISDNNKNKYTRTALLGIVAAREALYNAKLSKEDLDKLAVVSSTTVGGMDKTETLYKSPNANANDYAHTHPCGDSTNKICEYLGMNGYRTTISTACSSGANAIIHAVRLINQGLADMVIAGGVDSLSKFTLNGFNSLMIFDKEWCKPFDKDRRGLNLGEGAGFVVLESEESLARRKQKPICRLAGYANANDAYHQTASSPEGTGACMAMEKALLKAQLHASQIDYINVHGTGTENNDQSEGVAINKVFGNNVPKFSSTKAFTGHTLGAAAGIEAVFSVLAIEQQLKFPNLNFKTPIEDLNLIPETNLIEDETVNHVLSNSFGFGGNNSSLIFSKL